MIIIRYFSWNFFLSSDQNAMLIEHPKQFLPHRNKQIMENTWDGRFLSAACCLFACKTGQDSSYAAFLNDGEVVVEVRYHGFVEWIRKVGAT